MLLLDHITLTAGDFRLTAHWSASPGARIAVIGPSGGGKSTLLLALAGFIAPTQGRIRWQSDDLTDTQPGDRPISILFQDQNLFPHLTLNQNLGLGLNPRLKLTPPDHARIADVLDRTGLSGMGNRKPAALSGGQQARAALARTLLRARPILLLDEPFAALGPALKTEMLDLIADLTPETLTLLVTHDPQDARRFAPQTVLVANGIAHPPADTAALLDSPPPALAAYLGR